MKVFTAIINGGIWFHVDSKEKLIERFKKALIEHGLETETLEVEGEEPMTVDALIEHCFENETVQINEECLAEHGDDYVELSFHERDLE